MAPPPASITSPPYAGTYDYAEHQRLRFDFLGLRHREFDDGELGARRSFEQGSADRSRGVEEGAERLRREDRRDARRPGAAPRS